MEQNDNKNKNNKKRRILTIVFAVFMVLSLASFYGAYDAMYGENGTAMNAPEVSDESSDDNATKVLEESLSPDTEVSDSEDSSESSADVEESAVETSSSSGSNSTKSQKLSQPKQQTIDISITGWGSKTMVYESGDTVYSVLARCGAPVYVEDTVYGLYVVGINGLMEGDKGASSGWTYKVNGSMPMMSANKCSVNPGDVISWEFVK